MIVNIKLEVEDEDLVELIKQNKKLISDYNRLSAISQDYNLDLRRALDEFWERLDVSKQVTRSKLFDALVDHKVRIC